MLRPDDCHEEHEIPHSLVKRYNEEIKNLLQKKEIAVSMAHEGS